MIWAFLIIFLTFALPFLGRSLRQTKSLFFSYYFVIFLHHLVALTNAYWFTTFGAELDAHSFHLISQEAAVSGDMMFGVGGAFYTYFLSTVYSVLGSSHFLGEELSILAFSISCVFLLKILAMLPENRHAATPMLLLFGALPTMVLLGSVTLRESFQVLFFMMAVYYGMKMHLKGGLNVYVLLMCCSSLLMGLLHNGLLVFALFLIVFFFIWSLNPSNSLLVIKKHHLFAIAFFPILLFLTISLSGLNVPGLAALAALLDGDSLSAAATYREHSPSTRASYGVSLDLSNPISGIYTAFLLYLNYLFAPFPWQVRSIPDVYAFLESVMRLLLLFFSFKSWSSSIADEKKIKGALLMLFFAVSFLWAMGTTNYGTAMRHHLLDWWILVLLGGPLMFAKLAVCMQKVVAK